MTERDALLAAILSSPGDDTPRLIYADWLDERGEVERAEFIRVQCELARLNFLDISGSPVNPEHREIDSRKSLLRRRERELLAPTVGGTNMRENEAKWLEGSPLLLGREIAGGGWMRSFEVEWHRGFISTIILSWADFLRHHAALMWSPRQTVECPACHDTGWVNGYCCYICGKDEDQGTRKMGTGRIPRPFVNTAQPITDLILTTRPDISESEFALRWPGLLCKASSCFWWS